MKLVEAEEPAKLDGVDTPIVTPPRPPKRRVSVSLLFTISVLAGTVVLIYVVFPKRDNVLMTEAIARHRSPGNWELASPSSLELRAWTRGLVGADAPELPVAKILGAARAEILDRPVAIARLELSNIELTVAMQHARGIGPNQHRVVGDLEAITVRHGKYALVVVGPAASVERWSSAFR